MRQCHTGPRAAGPRGWGIVRSPVVGAALAAALATGGCLGMTGDALTDFDRFDGPAGRAVQIDAAVLTNASFDADPAYGVPTVLAAAADLDWAVVLDHSTSVGSLALCDERAPFEELVRCMLANPNLGPDFGPPADLTAATGHLVFGSRMTLASVAGIERPAGGHGLVDCLPGADAALASTRPVIDRPLDAVTGGTATEDCRARGGLSVLAAPFGTAREPLVGSDWDWAIEGGDGLAVFAGPIWDAEDEAVLDLWWCGRLAGRRWFGVAASNDHGPAPRHPDVPVSPVGGVRTSIWVEGEDWADVLDGLETGRTVVHSADAALDVRVYGPTGRLIGIAGDDLAADTGDELRFAIRGHAPGPTSVLLEALGPGACDALPSASSARPPARRPELLTQFEVCPEGPCAFELRSVWEAEADVVVTARFAPPAVSTTTMAAAAPMSVRLAGSLLDFLPLSTGGMP